MPIIAPSLLAADFLNLGAQCKMLDESEADWFHLDVMDGRFVPNISFGMPLIKAMRTTTKKFFDVHLMIVEPDKYIAEFKDAGADGISVHLEGAHHLHSTINHIRSLGMKPGVAINPHTPVCLLKDILADLDIVCIMSVNPGFGGQSFIPHAFSKVRELKKMITDNNLNVKIEVDGGVSLQNAKEIVHAGADILVAGNAILKSADPNKTIHLLKSV